MSSEIAGVIEEDSHPFDKAILAQTQDIENQLLARQSTDLTLSQRMLSACTGSLLTSLVVTPFDVVRIRLQQQELLYPAKSDSTECCRKVFWEETPSSTSVNSTSSASSAATSFKGNVCSPNSCYHEGGKITGTFPGISKIAAEEGICTLYRGLGLTLLMAIPSNIVYFSGYEFLRDSSPLQSNYPVLNPLICGAISRTLAATAVAPFELIKTRIQAVPASNQGISKSADIFKLVLRNCLNEIHQKGPISIFKGLGITLWRDVPFSGIYWSTYEYLTHRLKGIEFFNEESKQSGGEASLFFRSFVGGSVAGITAAVFTNPFDVGKTRLQVSFEDDRKLGTLGKSLQKKESMFRFMSKIYKNEGLGALYVGLLPRCMKVAPACAIMISTYELSKKFFRDKSSA